MFIQAICLFKSYKYFYFYHNYLSDGLDDITVLCEKCYIVICIFHFRIVSSEGQKLEYSWTVDFSATPKDQRYNLMIWQSVRMFQTYLKKASGSVQSNQISINTSMVSAHTHTSFMS
jgi:hypothetical protein